MAAVTFAAVMAYAAFAEGGYIDHNSASPRMMVTAGGAAARGFISGPGTGTSDSIPIRASHGEYMVKASSVSHLGRGTLDMLNNHPEQFTAAMNGANLPAMTQAAPYTSVSSSRQLSSSELSPPGGGPTFNHTTHIDGLQALDGASVRSALEEHGDLIGEIAVGAVKRHLYSNGVS
jgi:hypothetical protein